MLTAYCKTILERTGVNSIYVEYQQFTGCHSCARREKNFAKEGKYLRFFDSLHELTVCQVKKSAARSTRKSFYHQRSKRAPLPPITFTLSGHFLIGIMSTKYTFFSCRELCFDVDFLIDNIYVRFGNSFLRQVVGIPMGTNSAPLLAHLFLHIYGYDLLYACNSAIYLPELELKETTMATAFR